MLSIVYQLFIPYISLKKKEIMKNCPRCKSKSRQRMKRVGIAKYIYGLQEYDCVKCNKRYFHIPLLNLSFYI